MILFDKAGQWIYYEQPLRVLRDGKTIAMVRVKRRFSPQDAAAAIESEEAGDHNRRSGSDIGRMI
ncbi:MAG: hypothetical protein IPK83_10000 [Planctomycetes bacterium]|nr:hypothetical protein [Planctomycetota bacterium]